MRSGALVIGLVVCTATPAAAQLGAIGAATGAAAVATADGINSAPLLSESGLVLGQAWAANATFSMVEATVGTFDPAQGVTDATLTSSGFGVSAVFAPNPDLMLGASVTPYVSVSAETPSATFDDSGRGDASLFAKYRAWRSEDGRSSFAATGGVVLPVGSEDFGQQGASLSVAGAVSHRLAGGSPLTLHGSIGFSIPTDDADGKTTLSFSGAGVYRTSERLALSGELLGASSDGEYAINLAPGVRISANRHWLIDVAAAINVATSLEDSPFDYGLVLGGTYVP